MASRNWNRAQNLEKEVKSLFVEITIGGTGAPTLTRGTGAASVSRTSAGLYVITLQDIYTRFMHASITVQSAAAEDIHAELVGHSVITSAKTVTIRTVKGSDGTVVDPVSGDKIYVRLDLKNSSAL